MTDEDLLIGDNINFGNFLSLQKVSDRLTLVGSSLFFTDLPDGDSVFSLSQQPSDTTGTLSISRHSDNHSHQARREDITISRGDDRSFGGGASALYSGAASHYTSGPSLLGEDEMFEVADQNQLQATFGEQPPPPEDVPEFFDEPAMDLPVLRHLLERHRTPS